MGTVWFGEHVRLHQPVAIVSGLDLERLGLQLWRILFHITPRHRVFAVVFVGIGGFAELVRGCLPEGGVLSQGDAHCSARLGPAPEGDGFLLLQYHVVTDDPGKSERFRILSSGLRGKSYCENR